jgi:hypothetical protein
MFVLLLPGHWLLSKAETVGVLAIVADKVDAVHGAVTAMQLATVLHLMHWYMC